MILRSQIIYCVLLRVFPEYDNVCERAAVCGAGPESRLIVKKTIADGMTAAAALRPPLTEDALILTPEEWLKTASGQIEDIES